MSGQCTWIALLTLTALTATRSTACVAAEPPTASRASIPTRAERLTMGLRVRAPADVAFCEAVAMHVQAGRLPGHLVDSTYLWAIRRGKEYPFPAFAHVMRIKAAKLGVTLDPPAIGTAARSLHPAGGLR